jgi:hypothetical protein
VGFEALYWIPFVHHLAHVLKIAPARLFPITRGGAAAWYGTPQGLELYAMRTPQQVRVENRRQFAVQAMLKQTRVTPFDRAVLHDAAETLRLGRHYLVLHPAWMYQALMPFWQESRGLGWLQRRLRMEDLTMPPLPDTVTLPPQFVAVRFYARSTFPLQETNVQFARETIKQIASHVPVVLLNAGLHVDDHVDVEFKTLPPNVVRLTDLIPLLPEQNLAIQSAVLARALGFVGTYGGLAQLALRLKRPVVSVYSEWAGTALAHVHLSQAIALQLGLPFKVLGLQELPLIQDAMPRIVLQPQAPPAVVTTAHKALDTELDVSHA